MQSLKNSIVILSLLLVPAPLFAADRTGLSETEIDQLVARVMETFKIPGIAVGIIKDGKVIHAKGYGVREVSKKGRVNEKTLFSIASTGKSFTAAAVALLVDDGVISWKDKVIDHIPAFQLYDPWVTREFTIKDLLIHNSGLGKGAGDLMFWPTMGFSREEMIANLKHLKPVSSFRSEYAYDNLLYIVAGEVIAAVSGIPYEDFIDQRILKPLGMKECAANRARLKRHKNIAEPHMVMEGELRKVDRLTPVHKRMIIAAAGGIQCSVKSILKWHDMHLNKGRLADGTVFLSEAQQAEIMTPQTIRPVKSKDKRRFGTSFSAYGLGWALSDFHGVKIAQHGGALLGMMSSNLMAPDLGLGVAIYTNQQSRYARPAIMYHILEAYLTDRKTDWVSRLYEDQQTAISKAGVIVPDLSGPEYIPLRTDYAASYRDPWFGDIVISKGEEGLYFRSLRSEKLKGRMEPHKSDLFIVHWDDRSLEADAYVKFSRDYDGNPDGITMKAVSPLTDFSFDFHDLAFKRVEK